MDERLLVSVLQTERCLSNEVTRLRYGQRSLLLDVALQCDAGDVFHSQIMGVAGAIKVEDLNDIGMAKPGRGLRFAAETSHGLFMLQTVLADDLDGDDLLIAQLPGAV